MIKVTKRKQDSNNYHLKYKGSFSSEFLKTRYRLAKLIFILFLLTDFQAVCKTDLFRIKSELNIVLPEICDSLT